MEYAVVGKKEYLSGRQEECEEGKFQCCVDRTQEKMIIDYLGLRFPPRVDEAGKS